MFIVSKYEEILSPAVEDFACVTNHSYTKLQICQMEMKILQALGFCLGHPLPPHFLRRASMIAEVMLRADGTVSSIWKTQCLTVAAC